MPERTSVSDHDSDSLHSESITTMPPVATRVTRGSVAAAEDFASLTARDRLVFAQAVYEHGARQGSWAEIAKILSKHPLISKPKNFSNAQSCIAIYNYLMKEAELEKTDLCEAKKSPTHAQLAQRFYRNRVTELRDQIATEEDRFKVLVNQIEEIRAGKWDGRIRAKLDGKEGSLDIPLTVPSKSPVQEAVKSPPVNGYFTPPLEEQPPEEPQAAVTPVEVPGSDGEVSMDVSSPVRESSPPAPPPESSPPQESPKAPEEQIAESLSTESELSTVPPASEEQPPTSPKQMPKTRSQTRKEPEEAVETPAPAEIEDEEMAEVEDEDKENEEDEENEDEETAETEVDEQEEKEESEGSEETVEDADAPEATPDEPTPEEPMPREEEPTEPASRESTPVLEDRREGKRRASDVDTVEPSRDRKRTRDRSETVENAESPAPATPSAIPSATGSRDAKERKRFQSVILMLHSQITAHRNGTIFHNPIKPSEAPDYQDIVKRPMDLKTIKNRVKDGRISSSSEYQRDIYLMFANSLMYNRPNSDIYMMAEEMMVDSEAEIQNFQQTEAYNLRTRG